MVSDQTAKFLNNHSCDEMFLNKLVALPILFNVFSMIFQSLVKDIESPVASNSLLNLVTAYPTNYGGQKVPWMGLRQIYPVFIQHVNASSQIWN